MGENAHCASFICHCKMISIKMAWLIQHLTAILLTYFIVRMSHLEVSSSLIQPAACFAIWWVQKQKCRFHRTVPKNILYSALTSFNATCTAHFSSFISFMPLASGQHKTPFIQLWILIKTILKWTNALN